MEQYDIVINHCIKAPPGGYYREMSRIRCGKECTRSPAHYLSILLEPTPIDPTKIVTVPRVPLDDSSPHLGKILAEDDETVLSELCEVLKKSSASSTPIPGRFPDLTSLIMLEQVEESLCNHDAEVDDDDDDLSEKIHDWCGPRRIGAGALSSQHDAGLQKLRTNNLDFARDDADNQDASKSCSTCGVLKDKRRTIMKHLSPPCCSAESSSCNTTTIPARDKSIRSSVVKSSDKVKKSPILVGDVCCTPTTFLRTHQTVQWHKRYLDLVKFCETYGNCLVPLNWPSDPSLSHWVKRQRNQYRAKQEHKHSTLTDERQRLLEQLGFVWDSHSLVWEEHLKELQDFKETHGHCRVPKTYASNPQLAIWVKCQRRQFKLYSEGKDSNMRIERIHKLRKLGFEFTPRKQKKLA